MSFRSILLVCLLFSISTIAIAQSPKKFGKVSIDEFNITAPDNISEAHAIVLFHKGRTWFDYSLEKGFFIKTEVHKRIKILDEKGVDQANIELSYFENNRGKEKISGLKAVSYNLINGKIEETKLKKEDVFIEETSNYWRKKKFSMPNVQKGSIIELKYELISDFYYSLQSWSFQETIPVLWSEYTTLIPEYFFYNKTLKGYLPITDSEASSKSRDLTIQYRENASNIASSNNRTRLQSRQIQFTEKIERWVMKDIPPLQLEPYTTTLSNFISTIEFELASVNFPYSVVNNISTSWEDLDTDLFKDSNFGGRIDKNKFAKEKISSILALPTDQEKVLEIYQLVRNHTQWNKEYTKYARQSLMQTWKEQSGSVADINLLLVTFLKEAGLDAHPVLLSTRGHGYIPLTRPTLNSMNYVIAAVNIDGETIVLDATDDFIAPGMLPIRCLNDRGRLISKTGSGWIDLAPTKKYDAITQYELELDAEGGAVGKLKQVNAGYASYITANNIATFSSTEDYVEDYNQKHEMITINTHEINLDNPYKKIQEQYEIVLEDAYTSTGDLIYMNPLIDQGIEENPFKIEKRNYPVEYPYLIKETYVLKMNIPEGYVIEEVPENAVFSLPNSDGRYTYTVNQMGDQLNVISKFEIKKRMFLPDEYEALRAFYDLIIEKQNEQMVLKKG